MRVSVTSEQQIILFIEGMDCVEEVSALRKDLGPLVGGPEFLAFDLLNKKLIIQKSRETVDLRAIKEAITSIGLAARETPTLDSEKNGLWIVRHLRPILTGSSAILILSAFILHAILHGDMKDALLAGDGSNTHLFPWPVVCLYGLAVLSGGWFVFPKAFLSAKRFRPDMNLLMTVAVIGAMILGEWLEAATVTFLFSVSLLLESWSVNRARRATQALLDLTPVNATIIYPDGREISVPAADVSVGTHVLVKPGEKIPLDGVVLKGSSEVNQAPITGESLPVIKEAGTQVFAGTINGNGALEMVCAKTADHSTLSNIIRLVSEAHRERAPSEQWVEKFAHVYTPVVLALALAVLVGPPLVFGGSWSEWFYRSLVLLVIACPCALVISTPVSIIAALAAAAKNGILIKGGKFIELPAKVKAMAFDKTGTLTRGELSVSSVVPLNHHSEAELIAIAAAIESRSEHPIAKAILDYAKIKQVTFAPADEYRSIPGKGAQAKVSGVMHWLGSHRYLEEWNQETGRVHDQLEELTLHGYTVVVVGDFNHVCGFIAVSDTPRSEAQSVVSDLRAAGIQHMVMLTGDNAGTAKTIASGIGIDEYYAELLPQDKVTKVAELVKRYGTVAMVGDGVNDAPAMARATLGIAMGAAGSDAAIETADIALMTDELERIPWLIRHSRRTLSIIRINIALSIAIKVVFVALTFAGYSSLWGAIAADMGTSLFVIFNGLRLLR